MSAKIVPSVERPTHDQIAEAAYHIWLREGQPHGRDREHWTQAETQLIADRMQEAARTAPPQTLAGAIAQALPRARQQKTRTKLQRLAA
jgi:hypothetical protein